MGAPLPHSFPVEGEGMRKGRREKFWFVPILARGEYPFMPFLRDWRELIGNQGPTPAAVFTAENFAARSSAEDRAGTARLFETQRAERSEEHTSELQSRGQLVCGLLLEKKKINASGPSRRKAMTASTFLSMATRVV